tara:strand:+ start:1064 stop:1258 length:195 start_codon:yes stop_codon:yes gene_type:complete
MVVSQQPIQLYVCLGATSSSYEWCLGGPQIERQLPGNSIHLVSSVVGFSLTPVARSGAMLAGLR